MITLLRPSPVPHAWRQALSLFAISVWVMLACYWVLTGPVLEWLLRLGGPFEWSPPVSA